MEGLESRKVEGLALKSRKVEGCCSSCLLAVAATGSVLLLVVCGSRWSAACCAVRLLLATVSCWLYCW